MTKKWGRITQKSGSDLRLIVFFRHVERSVSVVETSRRSRIFYTKHLWFLQSDNNAYYQFNYMLSKVLYDLKQLDPSHRIPKVNLVGHSRGGLTNLQYALDHPDIVENLISIGTPYAGSTSANIISR